MATDAFSHVGEEIYLCSTLGHLLLHLAHCHISWGRRVWSFWKIWCGHKLLVVVSEAAIKSYKITFIFFNWLQVNFSLMKIFWLCQSVIEVNMLLIWGFFFFFLQCMMISTWQCSVGSVAHRKMCPLVALINTKLVCNIW